MKLKSDFVTNSSSSSFVVMGCSINSQQIRDYKRGDELDDLYDVVAEKVKGTDLDYSFGESYSYNDEVMVGICYTRMKDDETMVQFKNRVQEQIKEAFGVEGDVGHIEQCWMDN